MSRSSVFASNFALAFCLVTVTTVIVFLLTRAVMLKQFQIEGATRRQRMNAQETQLQEVIGTVKNAATTAAERVTELVESLREKNNETEEIDLSEEISALEGIATQIEQIGTTTTNETPANENPVESVTTEAAVDATVVDEIARDQAA